jgi:hypothetical protein
MRTGKPFRKVVSKHMEEARLAKGRRPSSTDGRSLRQRSEVSEENGKSCNEKGDFQPPSFDE